MIKINFDALGIAASLACAIHCALLPLLLTSLPVFGINIIDNMGFEYAMILLAFGIGAFTLLHGYRKHHHQVLPLIIFSAGVLLLFMKQVWHQHQLWFLIPAVAAITSAHFLNYRLCRKASSALHNNCNHDSLRA